MKHRSNKRKNWAEDLPEDARARMLQAVEDMERNLAEIDMLFPDERAEMEAGLKELRQSLTTDAAESEIVPAKHRLH
jgi:hypothetical protein